MCTKPISFLFGSTNVYGIIFYQVYLLPLLTIPPHFFCRIMVMSYLTYGSPKNLYQSMHKYVVIGLVKIYWSKPSENIVPNIICTILLRIKYMVSTKEEIIPNPPFQFSGPLLALLSVSSNVDFGDTRQVSLIGSYHTCYENINE